MNFLEKKVSLFLGILNFSKAIILYNKWIFFEGTYSEINLALIGVVLKVVLFFEWK